MNEFDIYALSTLAAIICTVAVLITVAVVNIKRFVNKSRNTPDAGTGAGAGAGADEDEDDEEDSEYDEDSGSNDDEETKIRSIVLSCNSAMISLLNAECARVAGLGGTFRIRQDDSTTEYVITYPTSYSKDV